MENRVPFLSLTPHPRSPYLNQVKQSGKKFEVFSLFIVHLSLSELRQSTMTNEQ